MLLNAFRIKWKSRFSKSFVVLGVSVSDFRSDFSDMLRNGCLKNKLYNSAGNLRVQIQTQLQISTMIKSLVCFLSFTIIMMTYNIWI